MTPVIEPVIGRYIQMTIENRPHRVYFEEAGQGIPLLCLHTAGSDGRQFRGLLNDPNVTSHFRVIAFDMPWHGKSSPPEGYQDEEYRLTTNGYTTLIRSFAAALGLERPVVMGCSIGGRIVLQLAARHPTEFRALIGLQSAAWQAPWYDTSWLHRPDVHGGEVCAALVSGLAAPGGSESGRHETLWHYMQGGTGIFKGDLWFYRDDADFRGMLEDIDTSVCPLWLLTGEYDYSCSPADTRSTAAAIPGANFVEMSQLGHFPMSENYPHFASYLHPVLDSIRAQQNDKQRRRKK